MQIPPTPPTPMRLIGDHGQKRGRDLAPCPEGIATEEPFLPQCYPVYMQGSPSLFILTLMRVIRSLRGQVALVFLIQQKWKPSTSAKSWTTDTLPRDTTGQHQWTIQYVHVLSR